MTPLRNLRDLPAAITFPAILSGLVVCVIGYTSPLIIVLQAAQAAKLPPGMVSSWVWAITFGAGLGSIIMSILFRIPMLGAWPTAGAALLVTALPLFPYSDAIGAYLLVGAGMIVLGFSGLFTQFMRVIPQPVVLGMLAGLLFRFGTGIFTTLPNSPVLVLVMIVAYFGSQRLGFRTPTIAALGAGVILAIVTGGVHLDGFAPMLATPTLTAPTFTPQAALSIALPLFLVVLTSQFAPGLAVMRVAGYEPPIDKALIICGIGSLIFGVFGSHGLCLGAITAAITANPEAHPDLTKRYTASFANGFWYLAAGLFGTTAIALFAGLPAGLIAATAGLALTPTLITSISGAMGDTKQREGGLVALLSAAANFTFLGVGAPFWALVFGVAVSLILAWQRRREAV